MGLPVKYEDNNLDALREKIEFFDIFWEYGWIEYFQRLNGFHEETIFQFTMNLTRNH